MRRRRRMRRLLRTIVVTGLVVVLSAALIVRARSLDHRTGRVAASGSTATKPAQLDTTVPVGPPDRLSVTATPMVLSGPLSRAATVVDGNTVLVLGGLAGQSPGQSVATVQRIDVVNSTVTNAGRLPAAAHDAAATRQGTSALVFGGGEAVTVDTVQRFPLATPPPTTVRGSSTTVATASGTGKVVGHLPRPRSDLSAVSVDGHSYVLGGFDGKAWTSDVLRTDDGVSFTTVAHLQIPVRYAAVVAQGHLIYVIGGQAAKGVVGTIQEVDVAAGSSKVVAQLPSPVTEATAFVMRGGVFLAGGRTGTGRVLADLNRVDLSSGSLTKVGTLPVPMADAAAAAVGDTVYLVGGEGVRRLASVLAVTPG